jgi:sugar lactone lactonase YvrE
MDPVTYVYDPTGEKVHSVQFRGADVLTPNSLFFAKDGRILVTPGCYEFRMPAW